MDKNAYKLVFFCCMYIYLFMMSHSYLFIVRTKLKCPFCISSHAYLFANKNFYILKNFIISKIAAASRDTALMSVVGPNSSNTSCLRSATPISNIVRQIRISGRLLSICDTVLIPELGYNGTIIDILGRFVIVLPHDYGTSIRRLPRNLKKGKGISSHQRHRLDRINVTYNEDALLNQGTFPSHDRGKSIIDFIISQSFKM